MAQDTTISVPANTWTQLTNADATSVTFQNMSAAPVYIKATVGAVPPTSLLGALEYDPKQGELNVSLANLAPGITATRLYAFSQFDVSVMISHA